MDSDSRIISADHSKWAKRLLWTLVEAANLYIDIEPFAALPPIPKEHLDRITDPAARKKWSELYTQLKLAVKKRVLKSWCPTKLQFPSGKPLSLVGGTYIDPHQCIIWAKGVDFEFPPALVAALTKTAESKPESETPAQRRKSHDITKERGCRRLILEHWDNIEKLHGPHADGRQVRNYILKKIDASERNPALKTVQNKLAELRSEKLIP